MRRMGLARGRKSLSLSYKETNTEEPKEKRQIGMGQERETRLVSSCEKRLGQQRGSDSSALVKTKEVWLEIGC